jgi:hypothetical protein
LFKSIAYAWAEPASFAVNVLEASVKDINENVIMPTSPSPILIA